jgi:hypothetical protein
MTEQRLQELVNKLELVTEGDDGNNPLTQDDYGDLYDICFGLLNDKIKTHSTSSDK